MGIRIRSYVFRSIFRYMFYLLIVLFCPSPSQNPAPRLSYRFRAFVSRRCRVKYRLRLLIDDG